MKTYEVIFSDVVSNRVVLSLYLNISALDNILAMQF